MIELRQLNFKDEKTFFEGMKEWAGEDRSWYTFAWKDGMPFSEMVTILEKEHQGIDLQPDRVPATMLYAFLSGEIIGRVSIRHELNAYLLERGGHVGYSVAPKFRKKGYATEMFRQALLFCRGLGLKKILMTCEDDNVPSWKIIENAGGVLEGRFPDEAGKGFFRKYWIELS